MPAIADAPMPRPKSKRNDVPAKIDTEVMRMARIISAYEDRDIADLVSETLRPIFTRRLAELQADAVKRSKEK